MIGKLGNSEQNEGRWSCIRVSENVKCEGCFSYFWSGIKQPDCLWHVCTVLISFQSSVSSLEREPRATVELLCFTMWHEVSATQGLKRCKDRNWVCNLQKYFILSSWLTRHIWSSSVLQSCVQTALCAVCEPTAHKPRIIHFQDHSFLQDVSDLHTNTYCRCNEWCYCRCDFGPKID